MAQFRQFNTGNIYNTIQSAGSSLPQEQILNFTGTAITVVDDPGSSRTTFTSTALSTTGGTMTGNLILNADPSTNLGAATKQYVDTIAAGLSPRQSCRAASTANLSATYNNGSSGVGATLTNSGTQVAFALDGVSLNANDRVLIKDQSTQAQNGIYTVTTVGDGTHNWVLTRSTDFDQATSAEVTEGAYTIISEGTTNSTNMFVETGMGPFTIGTTAIIFTAFNSAANINVTAPLSKSGNTISLTTPLIGTYGGTGVNNGSNTITLAGNLTTSGANPLTLTTTGSTSVTLPTSGTLVNTGVTTLSSLASIGTITAGVWNGSVIGGQYGGTGVNNGSSTITLGGSLTTSGAFASTFTMTNTTSVTFPTSGTLATTSQLPTLPLSLSNGGTNANLSASTGGIVYSGASAFAVLAGTATANQMLLSGASAAPAWSTATHPATTVANNLLYSSATNVISNLATANSGTLVTDGSGVPSISSTLPSAVQGNITSTGTITSGTWHGTLIDGTRGGTGVNNGSNTITLANNLTTSGNFALTLTQTGTTNVTLPTSGTLVNTTGTTGWTLQTLQTVLSTPFTTSSTTMTDLTGLSQAITPASSSNTILVTVNIAASISTTADMALFNLVRGSTPIGQGTSVGSRTAVSFTYSQSTSTANYITMVSYQFLDSPATTSSTTYKIQCMLSAAGTLAINENVSDANSAGFFRPISTITVQEIHG